MPRDGAGVFSKPAGTTAVANTTIESATFNTLIDDIVSDLNLDRPIAAGGTGASTAADARSNLGIGTMGAQNANNVDISGGEIDGVTIGANSAAAGTFTTCTVTTADINGGAIDGVTIGGSSAATGTFSTLTYSGTGSVSISRTDVSGSNRTLAQFTRAGTNVGQIAGQNGTAFEIRAESGHALYLGANGSTNHASINTSGAFVTSSVDIGGGEIDGTAIGANSASSGSFSTLATSSASNITVARTGEAGSNRTIALFSRAGTDVGLIAGQNSSLFEIRAEIGHELKLNSNGSGSNGITINTSGAMVAGSVDIGGGEIDGATIGANSAAAGTFTSVTATAVGSSITGGDGSSTTVATQLQANGNTVAGVQIINQSTSGSGYLTFYDGANSGRIIYDHSVDSMALQVAGTSRLTLTSSNATFSGNVVASSGLVRAGTNTSTQGFRCGSGTEETVVSNFGVFSRAGGSIFLRPNGAGSTTSQMLYDASGNLTAAGDVTASSDARLKEAVEAVDNASGMLRQMRPVRFTRKDTGKRGIGLIAQDVSPIAPEVVHSDEDGMLSVAYANLVSPLIGGWQEHDERIAFLEDRLARLEAR